MCYVIGAMSKMLPGGRPQGSRPAKPLLVEGVSRWPNPSIHPGRGGGVERHRVLGQCAARVPQSVEATVWVVAGVEEGLVPPVHGNVETVRLVRKAESGARRGKFNYAGPCVSDGPVCRGAGCRCGYVRVVGNGGLHRGHECDGYGDGPYESVCQGDRIC